MVVNFLCEYISLPRFIIRVCQNRFILVGIWKLYMTTNQIGMPSYNYQSLEVWIAQVLINIPQITFSGSLFTLSQFKISDQEEKAVSKTITAKRHLCKPVFKKNQCLFHFFKLNLLAKRTPKSPKTLEQTVEKDWKFEIIAHVFY